MTYLVGAAVAVLLGVLGLRLRDRFTRAADRVLTNLEEQQDADLARMRSEYENALHDYDTKPDGNR